jgi:hypothetical protein
MSTGERRPSGSRTSGAGRCLEHPFEVRLAAQLAEGRGEARGARDARRATLGRGSARHRGGEPPHRGAHEPAAGGCPRPQRRGPDRVEHAHRRNQQERKHERHVNEVGEVDHRRRHERPEEPEAAALQLRARPTSPRAAQEQRALADERERRDPQEPDPRRDRPRVREREDGRPRMLPRLHGSVPVDGEAVEHLDERRG